MHKEDERKIKQERGERERVVGVVEKRREIRRGGGYGSMFIGLDPCGVMCPTIWHFPSKFGRR